MRVEFDGKPKLEPIEGGLWRHGKRWGYWVDLEDGSPTQYFEIEEGSITDLDSIPRVPFVYMVLKGRTREGAAVHDDQYRRQLGKEFADDVLLAAMVAEGVPAIYRRPIYWGPKYFGQSAYDAYGTRPAALETVPAELGE